MVSIAVGTIRVVSGYKRPLTQFSAQTTMIILYYVISMSHWRELIKIFSFPPIGYKSDVQARVQGVVRA